MRLHNFIQRDQKKKKNVEMKPKAGVYLLYEDVGFGFSSDSLVIKLEDKMRLRHLW